MVPLTAALGYDAIAQGSPPPAKNSGAIAGIVIGVLAGIAALGGGIYWLYRTGKFSFLRCATLLAGSPEQNSGMQHGLWVVHTSLHSEECLHLKALLLRSQVFSKRPQGATHVQHGLRPFRRQQPGHVQHLPEPFGCWPPDATPSRCTSSRESSAILNRQAACKVRTCISIKRYCCRHIDPAKILLMLDVQRCHCNVCPH